MSPHQNPQQQKSTALEHETGTITCGSKARRKLYELEGVDDRVTFVGDALDAGRQAEENEYPREGPAEDESEERAGKPNGPRSRADEEVRELVESTTEADLDE